MKFRNSFFALLIFITLSCANDDPFLFEDDYSTVPDAYSTTGITPDTLDSGLIIYEIAEGDTSNPVSVGPRDEVSVYYTGRKTNGDIFDSTFKNGLTRPTQYPVVGFVDGFTEGMLGMKEGGKRVLVIPPSLGYEGTSNALRNDTLVFDIELEGIIF